MPLLSDEEVGLSAGPVLLADADVGLAPAVSSDADVGLTSSSGEALTPDNHGRVAAARIAKARLERKQKGLPDLNQNEQAAILDAYRQAAGLPTLSNEDTFQEAQKHIAQHQSDILNLAHATAASFERQAVNFVAPAVDMIHPNWGSDVRRDITAMNPFDPDKISGKAGGVVASLPLLLAGGSIPSAAAIFGLQSATESLATSDDTGVTGFKKWGTAAGEGAITAAAVLVGGKLSQWATQGLAAKIPQLQALLTAGNRDAAGRIIAREAAQAGINLAPQAASMLAGTIGSNLLGGRDWTTGLEETAFNAVAMTIGNHLVKATGDIAASRAQGPEPVGRPDLRTDEEIRKAFAISPPESLHPAGREPKILTAESVPNTAGTGADPETVYVSKDIPRTLTVSGKPVDVHKFMALHETTERALEDSGMPDDLAHAHATAAEHDALRRAGVDPIEYERAIKPHEDTAAKGSLDNAPADLDPVPYTVPSPAVPRPASVITQERDIHQAPEGSQFASPHLTYDVAHRMSPAGINTDLGPSLQEAKGENVWVRPSGEASNAKRQLLVQFSTHLINGERPRTLADDAYDKLYSNRPGYSRPHDFWELPQWIGVAARSLPNADVYVVRNLEEARRFLAQAKYGTVAMSALDVNTKLAQGLIDGYDGKVAIGGYTDMKPFAGRPNVTTYKAMPDWIKAEGYEFKDGTDYRHFKGTEVVPRLSLSQGCLHNCAFCGVEDKGKPPREVDPAAVEKQIDSFGDLKHRLIYINDKTFWQAKNSETLPDIFQRIKTKNPDFEGFIVQTSAAQMAKVTPEMIHASGVKYVELGVESYNDDILKSMHKPATTALIDATVQKIREAGARFIPNVMIGLPGETPETYSRTLSFLDRNRDIISHINAYNVALYSGSALEKAVGGVKAEADRDENVTAKSWQKTPEVDQRFHDAVMKFNADSLERTPKAPQEPQPRGSTPPPGEEPPVPPRGEITPAGGEPLARAPLEGEVVEPEHAVIPPRPPEEPPPGSRPGLPGPAEPEGSAGKSAVEAQLAAFTGDTRTTWEKIGESVRATIDGIWRYSGKMFPTLTRLGRPAGEKAATYISSKIWAAEKAAELSRNIVGGDQGLDVKLGALLTEDNLRSLAARAAGLGQVDTGQLVTPPGAKAQTKALKGPPLTTGTEPKVLTRAQIEKIKQVGTTIGAEGSPFKTEADYQAALRDPILRAALARVKAQYGPVIDDLFRKAQGLDPTEALAERGFHTGVRINLMAADPNAKDKTGLIIIGSKQGNLRNPMRRKTPFAKEATGTAAAYEVRFSKIIQNSIGRTADTSFKADFVRALKENGLAVTGIKGQLVSIGKHNARPLPESGHEDLFVRSDAYHEVRAAFDVDSREYNALLKGAADLFNKTALVSFSEAAYHLGNQASALVRAPGAGLVVPKLVEKVWGLLHHDPVIMAQASELARIGAWRTDMPETGEGKSKIYKYTLGLMGRVIGKMDQAGRLVLDDAFRGLADKGIGLDTDTNRRDFVNQLGQYNRRAQGRLVAFVRDTGIGPFATAGTNFYSLGIKNLILSPGMQATSGLNAAKLRVMVAGRFAAILGSVALVNYLRWGRVDGDAQTPVGAIKLDDGTDDKGRKTARYFDVASLLNITRGLRAVGARAMIEGPRAGKTGPEVASDAARDAINAAIGPFGGPIVRAAEVAATGESGGFQVGPRVARDENAPLAHLKSAILAANPAIAKLTGVSRSPMFGKFEVQERPQKTVAMQIAVREAARRVPEGNQTREEMDQTAKEHGYREAWKAGDHAPMIAAVRSGEINRQRADTLVNESHMSDLARTVHHLPLDVSLRVYDAGSPEEKADLRKILAKKIEALAKESPGKVREYVLEFRKRGLLL
jgi:hypothetical protein